MNLMKHLIAVCMFLVSATHSTLVSAQVEEKRTNFADGSLQSIQMMKDGRNHGVSKWFHANGNMSQEQNFVDGALDGSVKTYYPSGALNSEGTYAKNLAQGVYKVYFEDGTLQLEHPKKDNRYHGVLKWYHANGQMSQEQTFDEGVLNGPSKTYYPGGSLLTEGTYVQNLAQGIYKRYYEQGPVVEEFQMKDGKYHGLLKWYYLDGQIRIEQTQNMGVLNGMSRTYYADGTLHEETPFVDGLIQGEYKNHYANGNIANVFPFVDSKYNGVMMWYYNDGQVSMSQVQLRGVLDGFHKTYYENGQLKEDTTYVDGLQNGIYKKYYPNGQMSNLIPMRQNQYHGLVKWFDQIGSMTDHAYYINGQRQKSTFATSEDEDTGITTTRVDNADDSSTIIKTDKDGDIIGVETKTELPAGISLARVLDPESGIKYEEMMDELGEITQSESSSSVDDDGTEHTYSTDEMGNRTERSVSPDGTETVKETDLYGNVRAETTTPDGEVATTISDAHGNVTDMFEKPDGSATIVTRDQDNNVLETIVHDSNGGKTVTDEQGRTFEMTAPDENGETIVTTTDGRGNEMKTRYDGSGEVISETESRTVPHEDGEAYYRKRVNPNGQWEDLTDAQKSKFARSERETGAVDERRALSAEQEATRLKQVEEDRKWQAENRAQTDEKLAAIADEQAAAERRALQREEAFELRRQKRQAKEEMNELDGRIQDAHANGDLIEARKLEKEHDKLNESTSHLFDPTEADLQKMAQKDELRNKLVDEISGQARSIAKSELQETEGRQELKETVVGKTKYLSIGSRMQEETARTTRLADREKAFSEAKIQLIENRMESDKTTPEEKKILKNMLDLAESQKAGADTLLSDNATITAVGYGADVAILATGGLAGAGAKLGTAAVTKAAGYNAARRTFTEAVANGASRGTAQRLANAAGTQASDQAAAALAKRASESGAVQFLQTDLIKAGGDAARRLLGRPAPAAAEAVAGDATITIATDIAEAASANPQAERLFARALEESGVLPPPPGYVPMPKVGAVSASLSAAERAALFKPGANLTAEQIAQKADIFLKRIADAKAARAGTPTPTARLAHDPFMTLPPPGYRAGSTAAPRPGATTVAPPGFRPGSTTVPPPGVPPAGPAATLAETVGTEASTILEHPLARGGTEVMKNPLAPLTPHEASIVAKNYRPSPPAPPAVRDALARAEADTVADAALSRATLPPPRAPVSTEPIRATLDQLRNRHLHALGQQTPGAASALDKVRQLEGLYTTLSKPEVAVAEKALKQLGNLGLNPYAAHKYALLYARRGVGESAQGMLANRLTAEALIEGRVSFTVNQFMKETGLQYPAARSAIEEVAVQRGFTGYRIDSAGKVIYTR
jgi:YD repeat-containing protein